MSLLPSVQVRTQDPDLGRSLLLWLADVAQSGFAAGPWQRLVIDDDGWAGRPYRRDWFRNGRPNFQVVTEPDETVRFLVSSSALFLPPRPLREVARRVGIALDCCHDLVTLDHFRVVRHLRRLRHTAAAALGVRPPDTPCRFLLRVDDFPSPGISSEEFVRFHQIARESGLPYLVAVTPFLDRGRGRTHLTDREVDILHRCSQEGAELALHGFSHRSRYRNYPSELASLPPHHLREEIDRAEEYLAASDLRTTAFVAPFNSYDPLTVAVLAERYPLLGGGPESVRSLGYRAGPSFLLGSLYVPSYRYAYDVTEEMLPALDRLAAGASGVVVPITLHWPNERRTNWHSFGRLCTRLAGRTLSWGAMRARAEAVTSRPRAGGEIGELQETRPCA